MRDGFWKVVGAVVVGVTVFGAGMWWESKQTLVRTLGDCQLQRDSNFDDHQRVCMYYHRALAGIRKAVTFPCSHKHRWHSWYCWKGIETAWYCCDCGVMVFSNPLGVAYHEGKKIHDIPVHGWKLIYGEDHDYPDDFDWDRDLETVHGPFAEEGDR
jgi:hypothetical protein